MSRNIKLVEATLREIFEFYGNTVNGVMMVKSVRFQKLALDADLLDERLTSAKTDLIYRRLCGVHAMPFATFMDSVVLLAGEKYPHLPPQQATLLLYDEHFSTFRCPVGSVFDLDDQFFQAVEPVKLRLHHVYAQSFNADRQRTHFNVRKETGPSSTYGLKAFGSVLREFEIMPFLVSKAIVFATYREVSGTRPPDNVRANLPDPPGVSFPQFTFAHFVVALLRVAKKLFPHVDENAEAFTMLLERMDAMNPKAGFDRNTKSSSSRSSRQFGSRATRSSNSSMLFSPSTRIKKSSASGFSGTSRSAMETRISERRISMQSGHNEEASVYHRIVHQLFEHYAALGNPLNRSYLSTIKWNRFLRDAGLVSDSGHASPSKSGKSLLSLTDADLMFIHACGVNARHHMSVLTFEIGLYLIAEKLYGMPDSFPTLCDHILAPLANKLDEPFEHVSSCVLALKEREMITLFSQVQDGLARLFDHYARHGAWSAECFAKFCNDFDLTQEMSHTPLQRIFTDSVNVDGAVKEMSLLAFQLALVLIAVKIFDEGTIVSKVANLFHQLNAVAMANGPPQIKNTFSVDRSQQSVRSRKNDARPSTWAEIMI